MLELSCTKGKVIGIVPLQDKQIYALYNHCWNVQLQHKMNVGVAKHHKTSADYIFIESYIYIYFKFKGTFYFGCFDQFVKDVAQLA